MLEDRAKLLTSVGRDRYLTVGPQPTGGCPTTESVAAAELELDL
jgi:hypothetical protein